MPRQPARVVLLCLSCLLSAGCSDGTFSEVLSLNLYNGAVYADAGDGDHDGAIENDL